MLDKSQCISAVATTWMNIIKPYMFETDKFRRLYWGTEQK